MNRRTFLKIAGRGIGTLAVTKAAYPLQLSGRESENELTPLGGVNWSQAETPPFPWDNETPPALLNQKMPGFRGIWYSNQPSDDQYVYKYSGGLGTYCAKHRPFAIYRPEVDRTFFCYGGRFEENNRLVHMISYYDHHTGMVALPTAILDKQTDDAHDNPVLSIDAEGYLWIFASAHGTGRPAFILRSHEPFSIEQFDWVLTTNFSYPQPWYLPGKGFFMPHTIYGMLGTGRTLVSTFSKDGMEWEQPRPYAAIEMGHYQVTAATRDRVGVAFNMHPSPRGLNWRTNLYYMETTDLGRTWRSVDGKALSTPLTTIYNQALVHDYQAENLNVYMKDIVFDRGGHPIILYITSHGYRSGPENDPRTWTTARWTGDRWDIRPGMISDNNYDMGSLFTEANLWRLIAPTETGPQPYNPGGEVAIWKSTDQGWRWFMEKQLTRHSEFNHTYIRRVVDARDAFYAFWADGHGRQPSESRLYFTDKSGTNVWRLPVSMRSEFEKPVALY